MLRYNVDEARQRIVEVCRFPVPRSAQHIALELKGIDNFYPHTRTDKVVPLMRKHVLHGLLGNNSIIEYTPQDTVWEKARKLVVHYYSKRPEPTPRKLSALYQANFFYLTGPVSAPSLSLSKETNLDLVVLAFPFVGGRDIKNFSLEILNLMYCYSAPELHDKLRLQIYQLDFTEKEQEQLESLLSYCGESELKRVFEQLPFRPDLGRAMSFLEKL